MHPGYFPVLFWSLLIFASFWGFGELLRRRINRPEFADIGWGLTAAWGTAVVLGIGGVVMMLHLAKAPNLTVLVIFGAAAAAYYAVNGKWGMKNGKSRNPKSRTKNSKSVSSPSGFKFELSAFSFFSFILFLLAALAFSTSVFWPYQIDPNDDWIAYLMYPEKILQTGTFTDPFSLRRVAALGGQSFLQALIMIVGAPENGHILDRGFGALLLLGLLLEATKDTANRWWFIRFLVILAALVASVPRIHTGSHLLGLGMLLAMTLTAARLIDGKSFPLRCLFPVSLVLAGVSTFRPTYAMVGGGMLTIYFIWRALGSKDRRMASLLALLQAGALTFAFLLPYMILSWQSSGTPMFPFSVGYGNTEMMFGGTKEGGWTNWEAAFRFIALPEIAVMILGLFAAGMLAGEARRLGVAAALAGFGMVFLSAFKMSAAGAYDVYRYTYPLVGFALFWILARASNKPAEKWPIGGPVAAGVAVAVFFFSHWLPAWRDFQLKVTSLPKQLEGFHFPVVQLAPAYLQLQEMIPPGEKIFAVVDAPYLLDFARNPIDNIDCIGGASMPPGMPFEKGPGALKDYLKKLGFKYVLCVDFDNAVLLYTRKLWENQPRKEWYFEEVWGKFALDFMRNMDSIADWDTKAKAGNVRLIELQ